MKPIITYPIKEIKQEKNDLFIRAYMDSKDKNKIIQREGFSITIPNTKKEELREIIFTVVKITKTSRTNDYKLELRSPNAECCEKDTSIQVSKEVMKKWTKMPDYEIDYALTRGIDLQHTYNLLISIPRLIIIKKNEIEIEFSQKESIQPPDSAFNHIINREHPLDI
ncbi:hypothetical protein J4216_02235 [Candidatus Woesearchaeota archaeon]|nr:hypothetical protein [Candidatus Woesearchaeota archaeon]